jgi:hypothetical protein
MKITIMNSSTLRSRIVDAEVQGDDVYMNGKHYHRYIAADGSHRLRRLSYGVIKGRDGIIRRTTREIKYIICN